MVEELTNFKLDENYNLLGERSSSNINKLDNIIRILEEVPVDEILYGKKYEARIWQENFFNNKNYDGERTYIVDEAEGWYFSWELVQKFSKDQVSDLDIKFEGIREDMHNRGSELKGPLFDHHRLMAIEIRKKILSKEELFYYKEKGWVIHIRTKAYFALESGATFEKVIKCEYDIRDGPDRLPPNDPECLQGREIETIVKSSRKSSIFKITCENAQISQAYGKMDADLLECRAEITPGEYNDDVYIVLDVSGGKIQFIKFEYEIILRRIGENSFWDDKSM